MDNRLDITSDVTGDATRDATGVFGLNAGRGGLWTAFLLFLLAVVSGAAVSGGASGTDGTARFLQVGPDKIYYEISGDGPPLVIASGGSSMDLRQWDAVTPALGQTYRVVRYDPRGIGKSDNPTARYDDAHDINALLDHLGIRQAVLMGLSSAGGMVLEYVAQYPERVVGAVAMAPLVPGFEFSDDMKARIAGFAQAAERGREPFLDSMLGDPYFFPAPLNRSIRIPARENMGNTFDKGSGFDPALVIPAQPPLIERLTEITVPVLLIAGELEHPDVFLRNEFLLGKMPNSEEEIISDAGHNGQLENPAGFLAAVQPFLAKINR